MSYIFFFIILIISIEIFFYKKSHLKLIKYLKLIKKITKVFNHKKISDNRKQKFISILSIKIIKQFLNIIFTLVIILLPFILLYLISIHFDLSIKQLFYDYKIYIYSVIISILYLKIKKKFYER